MKMLSRDARGFIDGVTNYMRRDARGKEVLPRVQALFTKVTQAAKKERLAAVASVVVLTEGEKKGLQRVLANLLGHDVECRFTVDAELLGGMRIQVADWVVDTSVASQLTALTHTLL